MEIKPRKVILFGVEKGRTVITKSSMVLLNGDIYIS